MVVAGELSVIVKADTSSLEKASRRTNSALKEMEKNADNSSGSFERIRQTAGSIATTMGTFAKVGVAALTALGLASPVLAGQMAKLKTTIFELGNTMGSIIEPAVEGVGNALSRFSGFLKNNEGSLTTFTSTVVNGLGDALKGVGRVWDLLAKADGIDLKLNLSMEEGGLGNALLKQFGPEAVAALVGAGIGSRFGPGGAAIGAAVGGGGTAIARRIGNPSLLTGADESGDIDTSLGGFGRRAGANALSGAALGATAGAFIGGPVGAGVGGGIGAAGGFLIGEIVTLFSLLSKEQASADVAFATTGVS